MPAHRYTFAEHISFAEVEASLLLAVWGTESLHGETNVRLNVTYDLDEQQRTVCIHADNHEGFDLNRLFIGFLRREFRAMDFHVERIALPQHHEVAA